MEKYFEKKKRVKRGEPSKNQLAEMEKKKKPAANIIETVRNVKYEYRFLKTVHSLQELDDFRFQNYCDFLTVKRNINTFTRAKLDCMNRSQARGRCRYSLLVRRLHPESSDIHVYAHSEHNHQLKSADERAVHRVPRAVLVSDTDPPASFTTPDGRQWTFLGTAEDLKEVDKFRLKHHCRCGNDRYERTRITIECNNTSKKCQFRLLALKTERHRYHVYEHGRHTCCHADGKREAAGKKLVKATRIDEEKLEETQAMEEANEQMDVVEQSGKMEEQMEQDEAAENVSPSTSNSGDIEEELKEWPIEKIQRRLAKALRKESADKVIKWMARTGPDTIDAVMTGLDIEQVVELLEMAKKALRGTDKENASIWLDLVEYALSSRGSELAKVSDLVDGLLSRILRRIERRELLPKRRLKAFRKQLTAMRKHMQRVVDLGIFA